MVRRRTDEAEDQIAENARSLGKAQAAQVELDTEQSRSSTSRNSQSTVTTDASKCEIETRSRGGALTFGDPDPSRGFGRGDFGGPKGTWTAAGTISEASALRQSADGIANAATGGSFHIDTLVIGDGTSSPDRGDTALDNQTESRPCDAATANRAAGAIYQAYLPADITGSEFGFEANDGTLVFRAIADSSVTASGDEIRVRAPIEFTGSSQAGVVTETGDTVLSGAICAPNTTHMERIAIGTSDATPSRTDTDLAARVAIRDADSKQATGRSALAEAEWSPSEPAGQPYTIQEVGVFDRLGRLILRKVIADTTVDAEVSPLFGAETTTQVRG